MMSVRTSKTVRPGYNGFVTSPERSDGSHTNVYRPRAKRAQTSAPELTPVISPELTPVLSPGGCTIVARGGFAPLVASFSFPTRRVDEPFIAGADRNSIRRSARIGWSGLLLAALMNATGCIVLSSPATFEFRDHQTQQPLVGAEVEVRHQMIMVITRGPQTGVTDSCGQVTLRVPRALLGVRIRSPERPEHSVSTNHPALTEDMEDWFLMGIGGADGARTVEFRTRRVK